MWFRKRWRRTSDLLPSERTILGYVVDKLSSAVLATQLRFVLWVERNIVADGYSAAMAIRSRDAKPLDRLDGHKLARVRVSSSAGDHIATVLSVGGYVAILRFSKGRRIKDPTRVELHDIKLEWLAPAPPKRVTLTGWVKALADGGVFRQTTIPVSPEDVEGHKEFIERLPEDYLELVLQTNGVDLAIGGEVRALSEVFTIDMKGGRQVVCCGVILEDEFIGAFADDPKRAVYYFTDSDDPGTLAGSNLQEALVALPKLMDE